MLGEFDISTVTN